MNKLRLPILLTILALIVCGSLSAQETKAKFKPGDHTLVYMPTAYALPQGKSVFTVYDLVVYQYSLGVTGSTDISAVIIYPIDEYMLQTFTFGAKQNYLQSGILSSAAWIVYNPALRGGMIGNVVSVGNENIAIHASAAWITNMKDIYKEYFIMAGGNLTFPSGVKFIVEFLTTPSIMEDYGALLATGCLRFTGKKAYIDLAGSITYINDLEEDRSSVSSILPMFKLGLMF